MTADPKPHYLGDGAYVEKDVNGDVRLFTTDGYRTTNKVYLDPQAMAEFLRWIKSQREGV